MIQVAQLLLSLSILVFFHELGHFAFAKLFKTRVEKFYLFFNPWFSLFKFKKGETEYGIGWLPLGGYVKIAGMIDESMDKEQMKKPAEPWEFRSKSTWQRLLIMLGGVLVNFVLAFVIYMGILAVWGETYLPVSEINKNGIMVDSLGQHFGLQDGDKIVSVNDKNVKSYSEVYKEFVITEPHKIQIERDRKEIDVQLSNENISKIIDHGPFFSPRIPFFIKEFSDSSIAKSAGLLIGDKIVRINDKEIAYFDEFKNEIQKYKNQEINISVLRDSDTLNYMLTVSKDATIGVMIENNIRNFYDIDTQRFTVLQSIPAGINKTYSEVGSYLKQLKLVFTPKTKAYKSVGSFITIGKLFPEKWDWEIFWTMTALLSIMLGIINLLPIPGLDGGHVMFVLYEMIIGKKPSDNFLEKAQMVGMVILLALIVYALGNDIVRNLF
ncbi:MAG: RIP metalloprotease RseP [Bacteroidota bacterium]|nr:RIP metalloprotease RseP [Bacteroidota bacterium]